MQRDAKLGPHSYKCHESCSIVYEGSFIAWKSRRHFDLLIASHQNPEEKPCWEIIAFDAECGTEAPRIYLSYESAWKHISEDLLTLVATTGKDKTGKLRDEEITVEHARKHVLDYILERIDSPRKFFCLFTSG
jgi:hypothetical protein